jgi:hypothetical protein
VARRIRRGPSLAHSDGAVSVAYPRVPINVNTLFFGTCLSVLPFALTGCALERTSTFPSGLTRLLPALDALTIRSAGATTVIAMAVRRRSAYKPNKIHDGPILTFTPTYLEFHPFPSPTPIRIPWDHAPSITATDYPTVRADVIHRAHIMTTASPAPTLIDITCLTGRRINYNEPSVISFATPSAVASWPLGRASTWCAHSSQTTPQSGRTKARGAEPERPFRLVRYPGRGMTWAGRSSYCDTTATVDFRE